MGMARVVFRDGKIMHLECENISVDYGVLKVCITARRKDGTEYNSPIAIFAPGVWAYYVWVNMAGEA